MLVVDDSPEGGAESVVAGLRDVRISYMKNPRPTGGVPSAVRNLAWPHATGHFVHFLDDDDIVPSGHYRAVSAAFDRRPDVGLVFGRIEPFGTGPDVQLRHERQFFARAAGVAVQCNRFGNKLAFAGQMLFDLPLLVCSAGIMRRECVEGVGGFDPDIRLMEDADFNVRLMRKYGTCFLDRTALHYRIGFPSLMHAPDPPPEQIRLQREGRRRMQQKYRQAYGAAEFYALALFTRALRIARSHTRSAPVAEAQI
jgi:cellulose synthase/poly-beta-1,6-N-acetylglucosamine synthase-like glycosyltransferase